MDLRISVERLYFYEKTMRFSIEKYFEENIEMKMHLIGNWSSTDTTSIIVFLILITILLIISNSNNRHSYRYIKAIDICNWISILYHILESKHYFFVYNLKYSFATSYFILLVAFCTTLHLLMRRNNDTCYFIFTEKLYFKIQMYLLSPLKLLILIEMINYGILWLYMPNVFVFCLLHILIPLVLRILINFVFFNIINKTVEVMVDVYKVDVSCCMPGILPSDHSLHKHFQVKNKE